MPLPASTVAYFVWCWNDEEYLEISLPSFRKTTKDIFLVGILNASTDHSKDLFIKYCDEIYIFDQPQSISRCVNQGYSAVQDYDYLGWIHPDMEFVQTGWVNRLVEVLEAYPQIGKISPYNIKYGDRDDKLIYAGAEAGCLISRATHQLVGPYDERYIGCGGYEDWDMQKKLVAKNLANCITTTSQMYHRHVGTREKIDHGMRHMQFLHNQQMYHNSWRTYDYTMAPDGWQDITVT